MIDNSKKKICDVKKNIKLQKNSARTCRKCSLWLRLQKLTEIGRSEYLGKIIVFAEDAIWQSQPVQISDPNSVVEAFNALRKDTSARHH